MKNNKTNKKTKLNKKSFKRDEEGKRFAKKYSKIKYRCYNKNCPQYHRYGGRGIKISKEWADRENFVIWCKQTYPKTEGKWSLDRIDNDKDYSPDNCRWTDARTQANNRSSNVKYKGKTLAEWSKITGVKTTTINRRLHVMKWPLRKAIFKPVRRK